MYELVDGVMLIIVGIYFILAVNGKIFIGKTLEDSEKWIEKYGLIMKILAPIVILFGIYRLSHVLLG